MEDTFGWGRKVITCVGFGLVGGNGPQVSQIVFVSYEGDYAIAVDEIFQLIEPLLYIYKRLVIGDVEHYESTERVTIV